MEALKERRRRVLEMRLDATSLKGTAAQREMSRRTVIAAMKAHDAGGWTAVEVDRGGRTAGTARTARGFLVSGAVPRRRAEIGPSPRHR